MSMIRTRKNENPFVMIDKRPLEDTRLSWEAKGLHAYLMSKPDNWTVNVKHLIKQSRNGRDAVYRIVNELIAAGYIERHQDKAEDGKFGEWEYIVHELPNHFDPFELPKTTKKKKEAETPHPENPDTVETPHPGFPDPGNPDISNNDFSNNDLKNKRNDDDSAPSRDSINLQIFEEYKEQITPEQFAIILERIPSDKFTGDYRAYLKTCVKREIQEIQRKKNEDARKEAAAAKDTTNTYSKPRTHKRAPQPKQSHLKVVPKMPAETPAPEVSDDEFESMLEAARQMQANKGNPARNAR